MIKYNYNDIKTIDDFKLYVIALFPCINLNNIELITALYNIFKNSDTKRQRTLYDNMSSYMRILRNNKGSSKISVDFWKSMGWNDLDDIKQKISIEQRKRSKRCKEYYIEHGYTEIEAIQMVAEYQSVNGKTANTKYTKEELKKQSVWSIAHWIELGYTEEAARNKIRQYNGSCKECYSDENEFFAHKKKISEQKKDLYKSNPEKFWRDRPSYSSKEETDFFNNISKELHDIQYLHFGINVQNTELESLYEKSYIICDSYIKCDDKIIILEYDGTYWHNKEYDELRDNVILELRNDIIGIIRINDNFVKSNSLSIIKKEIEYAIEEIKSKKCKRKLIYEG